MRVAARRWRRALAAAAAATVLACSALVGLSVAAAQASDDTTEEISPEQYAPPSEPEKTVTPKPPVSSPPELVRTGVELPTTIFTIVGIGLLVAGVGLLVVRRRLSHD
jgi:LPXTG-motif cell wall-anchored protein